MNIFEITKILFENPLEWLKLSKTEKKKHFFLIHRFMSIIFPLQAQSLNHTKINFSSTLDFWQQFMRIRYKKTPFWMYIKGSVKKRKEKEKKINITEKSIKEFAKAYNLEIKSVKDSLIFFTDQTIKEIKKFEKITNAH